MWKKKKEIRFYSCSIYRSLKKEKKKDINPDFKTREDWMRTETQCIVLGKKTKQNIFQIFLVVLGRGGRRWEKG